MSAILETSEVTKRFGAVTAASSISLSIEEDTVVGLIGSNGAGKTTFVNLVTGYLKPTSGSIRYRGRDITSLQPRQITRLGVCRSFQIPQVFDTLTAYENLLVGLGIAARHRRSSLAARSESAADAAADEILQRFGLDRYRGAPAATLPEGVRKLLDIAMALVGKPQILLLDEPTSGVSSEEKFAVMDLVLGAIRAERVAVLFVEHDMDIVRRYTQRVVAFYEGRVIADGPTAQVLDAAEVRRYVVGEPTSPVERAC
jgi:branched-chain amino acid transport system ATP-binding protein